MEIPVLYVVNPAAGEVKVVITIRTSGLKNTAEAEFDVDAWIAGESEPTKLIQNIRPVTVYCGIWQNITLCQDRAARTSAYHGLMGGKNSRSH
jgi:hypothetical protein